MKMTSYLIGLCLVTVGTLQTFASEAENSDEIVLFAASSTLEAIEAIKSAYESQHPSIKIRVSYGASALLARQISMGAPADLFLSANINWIHWLGGNKTNMSAPIVLAGNNLMLISQKNSKTTVCPHTAEDFIALVGDKRFVIADPNVSPLGQYTKETLLQMGVWGNIEKKLAIAGNANLVVKMIERGAAPYGIAYASSTTNNNAIKALCLQTIDNLSPINYYLVATKAPSQATSSFTQYLAHESNQHWLDAGFVIMHQNDTIINESK